MNRNQGSRFSLAPQIRKPRSTIDRDGSVKTTGNIGQIIPFYLDEILPGDSCKIKTSKVVRLQTLITPVMDNIYLDTYYFFVPNRLVWDHWVNLMGENTESAWIPETTYTVPQITSPSGGWQVGTIADYMGIPINVPNLSVSALPFRAYALICNEWFRDENLSDPLNIPMTDATVAGSNGSNDITDVVLGGKPYMAAKLHDYFTSALPSPQRGVAVDIPIGGNQLLPVYSLASQYVPALSGASGTVGGLTMRYVNGDSFTVGSNTFFGSYATEDDSSNEVVRGAVKSYSASPGVPLFQTASEVMPSNLWAYQDVSTSMAPTINQLRIAFQTQALYEADARGGSRYIELLYSHFSVTNPDYRLQRPEYLGGNRIPVTINQVLQTSGTAEGTTPQGTPTGQSLTTDVHFDVNKSFTEHGLLIGVMVMRYNHTYQQGLAKLWTRKDRLDFYWPVFANIGEQPIYNREIYAQGSAVTDPTGAVVDDKVFGYQEAWAEYRYKPSIVTGELRSQAPQSLDVWHLGDDYDSLPYLSDEWIREDPTNVDRVLAVTSSVSNQYFADIYVQNNHTRVMPLYSIPGIGSTL